jgi:hypothetical protein
MFLVASVLHLRGVDSTFQPVQDGNGNVLLWNGEIFGGIDVCETASDTSVLSGELSRTTSASEVISVMSRIEGPWAFVYWQVLLRQRILIIRFLIHPKQDIFYDESFCRLPFYDFLFNNIQAKTRLLYFGRDRLGRRSLLLRRRILTSAARRSVGEVQNNSFLPVLLELSSTVPDESPPLVSSPISSQDVQEAATTGISAHSNQRNEDEKLCDGGEDKDAMDGSFWRTCDWSTWTEIPIFGLFVVHVPPLDFGLSMDTSFGGQNSRADVVIPGICFGSPIMLAGVPAGVLVPRLLPWEWQWTSVIFDETAEVGKSLNAEMYHEPRVDAPLATDMVDRLSVVLKEAVRKRVMLLEPQLAVRRENDAAVGVLFSGGLDCSVLAALAAESMLEAHGRREMQRQVGMSASGETLYAAENWGRGYHEGPRIDLINVCFDYPHYRSPDRTVSLCEDIQLRFYNRLLL